MLKYRRLPPLGGLLLLLWGVFLGCKTAACTPKITVSTFAGSGKQGGADGPGNVAEFHSPRSLSIDSAGNLYVWDNNGLRRVSPEGEVCTPEGGVCTPAHPLPEDFLELPPFFAGDSSIDSAGNLYVKGRAFSLYYIEGKELEDVELFLKITPKGAVSRLSPEDYAKIKHLPLHACNTAIDTAGNRYVLHSHRIYQFSPGEEVLLPSVLEEDETSEDKVFAGSGSKSFLGGGFADGVGTAAQFQLPTCMVMDVADNLYVVDGGNHSIRKVSPQKEVSTFAGNGEGGFADGSGRAAQFFFPWGITIDKAGNLYVVDGGNHRIRKISPKGEVSTLAGKGEYGFADGPGNVAQFANPMEMVIDIKGNLYVADEGNHRIRKVEVK